MATKLSNEHIEKIILESKNYYILDVYVALSHISSDVKGKYIIQTYRENKSELINLVKKYIKLSYKTIQNNINKLIELDILGYDKELFSWILLDMENMTKSNEDKSKTYKGYTVIREFFLSDSFRELRCVEKRCLIYLAQLSDSKDFKFYNGFFMNLFKKTSKWKVILKTKCKYNAKYIIKNMLDKHKDLFVDKSEELRLKDLAPSKISNFKFSFTCNAIKKVENDNSQYELIKLLNPNEFILVKERIKFFNLTLSKNQMMHIVRAISNIQEWILKERVLKIIINKYIAIQIHKSRENIKSLPAYITVVVKSVIEQFRELKSNINTFEVHKENIIEDYMDFCFIN